MTNITVLDSKYNTAQLLIIEVRDFLLKQNAKSTPSDDSNRCLYNSPTGLKCAVGCLIPSTRYKAGMEDKDVETLAVAYPTLFKYLCKKYKIHSEDYLINILTDLQSIHDYYDISDWQIKFDELINSYSIEIKNV